MESLCELVKVSSQDPPTEVVLDQFFGPADESQLSGILGQKNFVRKTAEVWEHTGNKTLQLKVIRLPHLRTLKPEDY